LTAKTHLRNAKESENFGKIGIGKKGVDYFTSESATLLAMPYTKGCFCTTK